jgi:hypothetical protein
MAFFSLTNVMIKCLQKVFGEKFGVFLINQCYDQIFSKSSSSLSKKIANNFAKFFGENIFKIITSVPVLLATLPRHHRRRLRAQGHQLGPADRHQTAGAPPAGSGRAGLPDLS